MRSLKGGSRLLRRLLDESVMCMEFLELTVLKMMPWGPMVSAERAHSTGATGGGPTIGPPVGACYLASVVNSKYEAATLTYLLATTANLSVQAGSLRWSKSDAMRWFLHRGPPSSRYQSPALALGTHRTGFGDAKLRHSATEHLARLVVNPDMPRQIGW